MRVSVMFDLSSGQKKVDSACAAIEVVPWWEEWSTERTSYWRQWGITIILIKHDHLLSASVHDIDIGAKIGGWGHLVA